MKIETTTEQIDLICNVSIVFGKCPTCFSETGVDWIDKRGFIEIDFQSRKIFISMSLVEEYDSIYFSILGIGEVYDLEVEYLESIE